MKSAIFAAFALSLMAVAANAQDTGTLQKGPSFTTLDYSTTLTTTPVQVIPPAGQARQFERVINAGAAAGGVAWCSRFLTTTLGANVPGAFPLAPYGNSLGQPTAEEFSSPDYFVPNTALWCVASVGTVPLTAEVSPR